MFTANYVGWPRVTNSNPPLDDTTLQSYVTRQPNMAQGDTLIMVETHMDYTPAFGSVPGFDILGLGTKTLNQIVIIRPRISAQVTYNLNA